MMSENKSKKKPESTPHAREKYQEIARAADTLFQELGYSQTTMEKIALSLGIGRTTLYDYFKSKQDILFYLIEDRILSEKPVVPAGTFKEKLRVLIITSLERLEANLHLYRILFTELPVLEQKAAEKIKKWQQQILNQTYQAIQSSIEKREFKPRCTLEQVMFMYQALVGQRMNQILLADIKMQSLEQEATILMDLLLYGIGDTE